MARIVVVGDVAGGAIQNSQGISATLNGAAIAVHGDAVAPHGTGPHANATMIATQARTTINGRRVIVEGDLATCGHAAVASNAATID